MEMTLENGRVDNLSQPLPPRLTLQGEGQFALCLSPQSEHMSRDDITALLVAEAENSNMVPALYYPDGDPIIYSAWAPPGHFGPEDTCVSAMPMKPPDPEGSGQHVPLPTLSKCLVLPNGSPLPAQGPPPSPPEHGHVPPLQVLPGGLEDSWNEDRRR